MTIICPLCQAPFTQEKTRWICDNAHSFDVSKQGYVNLLPVQHKNSKNPGDTPEAVAARRAFLQADFYEPLREVLMQKLAAVNPARILDLGCGEGYYTSGMSAIADHVIGLDIAKPAVQIAAKRYPNITWLVASGAKLPITSGALDAVCSFFSPLPIEEMARVLTHDGHLMVATPATEHLYELRAALFDQVNPHQPEKFIDVLSVSFQLIEQQTVSYPLHLNNTALIQLLAMTPYAWKAKADKRYRLEQLNEFVTQASFQVYVFQKI